jgi:hypothetical protein
MRGNVLIQRTMPRRLSYRESQCRKAQMWLRALSKVHFPLIDRNGIQARSNARINDVLSFITGSQRIKRQKTSIGADARRAADNDETGLSERFQESAQIRRG